MTSSEMQWEAIKNVAIELAEWFVNFIKETGIALIKNPTVLFFILGILILTALGISRR